MCEIQYLENLCCHYINRKFQPQNVYDILLKMREGDFDIDYEEIRKVGSKDTVRSTTA